MEDIIIKLSKGFEGEYSIVSGGNANFTVRVALNVPYQGKSTVIVKHGEAFAKYSKGIALDLCRMKTEGKALEIMNGKVFEAKESGIKFRTPKLYHHDLENNNLVMEDLGNIPTLKEFVGSGKLKNEDLLPLSSALGNFLHMFHDQMGKNEEMKKLAKDNEWGKKIGIWREYGILESNSILDEDTKLQLKPIVDFMTKRMEEENEIVLMGDMWPGNLLVKTDDEGRVKEIYVVDWEMMRTGPYGIELGQLYAECFLLHFFKGVDVKFANAMVQSYPLFLKDHEVQRMVAMQAGFHLFTWVPMASWGGKEETEECAKLGAKIALEGWKGNRKWIEEFFGLN
eukprot:TRINITY_DN5008_c0_g1_i1.p1 TRINITY_DN5008_c0_g1~~TRINITY_DN5008_c0_g1_i1.p1  ORF type:complete len:340 (+),score=115.75 TRINITY_DN5008_c0_g1_i1:278-1297(+)